MTHNRESYETLSLLSPICDISSSLPLGKSHRLLPKVHSPSAHPSHFLPEATGLARCDPILSSYRFQQVTARFNGSGLLVDTAPLIIDRFVGFVQHHS